MSKLKEKEKNAPLSREFEAARIVATLITLLLVGYLSLHIFELLTTTAEESDNVQDTFEAYEQSHDDAMRRLDFMVQDGTYVELQEIGNGLEYTMGISRLGMDGITVEQILQADSRLISLPWGMYSAYSIFDSNYLSTFYVAQDRYLIHPSPEGAADIEIIEEVLRIKERYPIGTEIAEMSSEDQARLAVIADHDFSALIDDIEMTRQRNMALLRHAYEDIISMNPELLSLNTDIDNAQQAYAQLEEPTTESLQRVYDALGRRVSNLQGLRLLELGFTPEEFNAWSNGFYIDSYYVRYLTEQEVDAEGETFLMETAFSGGINLLYSLGPDPSALEIVQSDELAREYLKAAFQEVRDGFKTETDRSILLLAALLMTIGLFAKLKKTAKGVRGLERKRREAAIAFANASNEKRMLKEARQRVMDESDDEDGLNVDVDDSQTFNASQG